MQTAQAYSHCQRLPTALQTELLDCDLGIWDGDLITGKTYDDPLWKKILGYELEEIENHHQQKQKYGGRSHKPITQRFSLTLIEDNQISDLVRDLNLHWTRQKIKNSTFVLLVILYFLLPFALPFGQSRI